MFIPRKMLALFKCVSASATRYTINGVHFIRTNDGHALAEATDGHQGIRVTWKDAETQNQYTLNKAQVPGFHAVVSPYFASLPGKEFLLDESNTTDLRIQSRTGANGFIVEYHNDDAKFPPLAEVIPNYDKSNSVSVKVNCRILAKVLTTIDSLGFDSSHRVILTISTNSTKPIKITQTADDVDIVAVVMPTNEA